MRVWGSDRYGTPIIDFDYKDFGKKTIQFSKDGSTCFGEASGDSGSKGVRGGVSLTVKHHE